MNQILKTKEPFFSAVKSGAKNFEVRQYTKQKCGECDGCSDHSNGECDSFCCDFNEYCDNPRSEREFNVGDQLILVDYATKEEIVREITYVLKDTDYPAGIKPGFCVLGLTSFNLIDLED